MRSCLRREECSSDEEGKVVPLWTLAKYRRLAEEVFSIYTRPREESTNGAPSVVGRAIRNKKVPCFSKLVGSLAARFQGQANSVPTWAKRTQVGASWRLFVWANVTNARRCPQSVAAIHGISGIGLGLE